MNKLFRIGLILMTICLVAALGLAVVNKVTSPIIRAQEEAAREAALSEVLPQAEEFRPLQKDDHLFHMGYAEGKLVGSAFEVSTSGYGGRIEIIMGVDRTGRVTGVKVLSHTETPGLGARITEVKPGDERPWFTQQFRDKVLDELVLRKDDKKLGRIDAITGATTSSRAVTKGVREGLELYLKIFGEEMGE